MAGLHAVWGRLPRALLKVASGVLIALSVAALGGCGSSSPSSSSSPLATALSYLPANSPLVIKVATNPHSSSVSSLQSLLSSIPAVRLGEAAVVAKLEQEGISYDSDIRPLLGNPLVFGASTQSVSRATGRQFIFAWVVKNPSTLRTLLSKGGRRQIGSHDGAALYPFGNGEMAVKGATVVASGDTATVTSALNRHAAGGGVTAGSYARATTGLPTSALVDVFGNLAQVLSSPRDARARRVPWVAAIKGYAVSLSAASGSMALSYRLDTSGGTLTSAQLPLSPGAGAPKLTAGMPIEVGIDDPAHSFFFLESVEQATGARNYGAFLGRQAALRKKTGVDLNTLAHQLSGDLDVESNTSTTIGRAAVSNPTASKHVLAKLASAPPKLLFTNATAIKRVSGGLYSISRRGKAPFTVGVIGNQLVAGKATAAQLRAFATAPSTPAPGAKGALAFRIALPDLIHLALHRSPSQAEALVLSVLGELTGYSGDSPSALNGNAALQVK